MKTEKDKFVKRLMRITPDLPKSKTLDLMFDYYDKTAGATIRETYCLFWLNYIANAKETEIEAQKIRIKKFLTGINFTTEGNYEGTPDRK